MRRFTFTFLDIFSELTYPYEIFINSRLRSELPPKRIFYLLFINLKLRREINELRKEGRKEGIGNENELGRIGRNWIVKGNVMELPAANPHIPQFD